MAQKRARTRSRATAALFAYDRGRGDVVVGVDEAGRGCLAGPLVAAAVCIDHQRLNRSERLALTGLNDSKQVPELERARLFSAILRSARRTSISVIDPSSIDRIGLHRCNLGALRMALERTCTGLGESRSVHLVDGYSLGGLTLRHEAIAKGDGTSAAIAAASILAKVTRDELMRRAELRLPGWGFARHVGYATEEHLAAIERLGPSPIHRMSFQCSAYPGGGGRSERTDEMFMFDDVA